MGTITKGLAGQQDLHLWDGTATKTFTRPSSSGYTITLNDLDYMVDVKAVYGGNVIMTRDSILAALTAVGTANQVGLRLAPGDWTIASNLDASSYKNVFWLLAPGATISPAAGITVTLYSPENLVCSPRQKIFGGAGTIAFSVGGTLYPDWWGATVDSGDVSTTFQLALTAMATSTQKCTLKLNQGTYTITGCSIDTNAYTIQGSGRNTWLLNQSNTGTMLTLGGSDFHLADITFGQASGDGTAGKALYIYDAAQCTLENLYISGYAGYRPYTGLRIEKSSGMFLSNIQIEGCIAGGAEFADSLDVYWSNGRSDDNGIGVSIASVGGMYFTNVTCYSNTDNWTINDDYTTPTVGPADPANFYFVNCVGDSGTNSNWVIDSLGNSSFTQCWASYQSTTTTGAHGIIITNSYGITFSDCQVFNNNSHGIQIFTGCFDIKVRGGQFVDNGQVDAASAGIYVATNLVDFSIQGVRAANKGGTTQDYGIYVNTGASDRYIIADNLVSSNADTNVSDNGTGINKRVANNY